MDCILQVRIHTTSERRRASYSPVMSVTWTTNEQHDFLKAELPDFRAAQRQHRGPQFLKGLAERWFEKWPERDVLIPDTRETSPAPSTPKEEKLTTAIVN